MHDAPKIQVVEGPRTGQPVPLPPHHPGELRACDVALLIEIGRAWLVEGARERRIACHALAEAIRRMMEPAAPSNTAYAIGLDDVGLVFRSKYATYLPAAKKAEARSLGLRMLKFTGAGGVAYVVTHQGREVLASDHLPALEEAGQ